MNNKNNGKKKNDDTEELTEQQKKNRQNYTPEPWLSICPHCKRFHNAKNCSAPPPGEKWK